MEVVKISLAQRQNRQYKDSSLPPPWATRFFPKDIREAFTNPAESNKQTVTMRGTNWNADQWFAEVSCSVKKSNGGSPVLVEFAQFEWESDQECFLTNSHQKTTYSIGNDSNLTDLKGIAPPPEINRPGVSLEEVLKLPKVNPENVWSPNASKQRQGRISSVKRESISTQRFPA